MNNRTAMKEAIDKALKGKPTIKDLLKEDRRNRDTCTTTPPREMGALMPRSCRSSTKR